MLDIFLRDGKHQLAYSFWRQGICGNSSGFGIDRTSGLEGSHQRRRGFRLYSHDCDSFLVPRGNAANQTAATYGYE